VLSLAPRVDVGIEHQHSFAPAIGGPGAQPVEPTTVDQGGTMVDPLSKAGQLVCSAYEIS